jgi:hypothetical protein
MIQLFQGENMENPVTGQRVILLKEMLGEPIGSVGYVVDTYPDFDIEGKLGTMILFSKGGYDGFSFKEQELFLEAGRVDPRYTNYEFSNVIRLEKDYRSNYWDFK